MNRRKISISVFLCFLMMMLLVVIGCGSSNDAIPAPTYSISGTVTGATSVTMNLTGDVTGTTTTAADGTYSFSGIPSGSNGTVTPVKTGFTFQDLCMGGTITENKTANFIATAVSPGALTYTISGNVSTAGSVLAGVTINLTGDATGFTVTNALGNYSFPGIALNGNYTVTPSLAGYTFSAINIGVIVSGADSTGNNFTATANAATTYTISGTVTLGGAADAGVTVTLSGGTSGTTITATGTDGTYSFPGLLPGDYTVTASKAGYTFSAALTPTIAAADVPSQNFTSTVVPSTFIYTISGTVNLSGGGTLNGVTINLTGAATASTTGGAYSFPSLANGAYTVMPVLAGYTFSPSSIVVNIASGSISGRDFTATANSALKYSICGKVTGEVLSGVTITLSGDGSAATTTNGSGNYCLPSQVNGSYTVTPTLTDYTITPASRAVSVSGANVTVANFVVGTAPTAFSQADLTGTWRANILERGKNDEGNPKNKVMRGRFSIASDGRLTCLSMSEISYNSSTISTGCQVGMDLVFTMNPTTGVITQSGVHATGAFSHMTMTSTKNFVAGTGTNGESPNFSYQLAIMQKEGTYIGTEMNTKSFVYHQLWAGTTTTSNMWSWGTGSTNGSGVATMTYDCSSHACPETPGGGGTLSVATTGVVTMSDDPTWEGFLSADKKTVVGTSRSSNDGGQVSLMIVQVVADGDFTAGALPAGIAVGHMLGAGTGFAGWVHFTNTVAPGGGMTYSDWADSFGGSAPSGTYTGSITASGTLTIAGNPTYHGQVSHDGEFTVGTHTGGTSPNFVYMLNVTTK